MKFAGLTGVGTHNGDFCFDCALPPPDEERHWRYTVNAVKATRIRDLSGRIEFIVPPHVNVVIEYFRGSYAISLPYNR